MGCLLGCFGRRKNRRRQRRRESFQPRLNRVSDGSTKDVRLNLTVPCVEEVPKSVNGDHLKLSVPSVQEVPTKSVNGDHLKLSVPLVEDVVPKSGNGDHLKLRVPSVEDVVPKSVSGDNLKLTVPSVEEVSETSVVPITKICDKGEEKKSTSPSPSRKRVTFYSNVRTYEHIAVEESIELFEEKKEEVKSLKSRQSQCSSEGSDVTTNSSGSYPSNHRYQNCRESDDEEEDVTDCDDSDLDDDDDDELLDEDYYNEYDYEDKLNKWDKEVYTEEIADNVMDIERAEEKPNVSARDRSGYVNAVLNPIENLTQWKAVKSKGRTTQTLSRKENMTKPSFSLEEPEVNKISSSSSSSSSSLFSLNLKPRDETKKQRTQDIAVDASLSTWLSTSETSSVSMGGETAMSEKKKKEYSKAVQSHDERPILGALTAEDIKQFSATNSPRKSPSRSPESPIIGTVGHYWNNHSMVTSKYRDV